MLGGASGELGAELAEKTAWIVPNRQLAEQLRRRALAGRTAAALHPEIRTLRQAAVAVLGLADVVARPLSPAQNYWLVRQLIDDALERGRLDRLSRIESREQLTELAVGSFANLALALPPGEVKRAERLAARTRPPVDVGEEMLALYGGYRLALARHRLLDDYGRLSAATELVREGQTGPFREARQLVAIGMHQLRRVEQSFVTALGAATGRLVVTLPWPAHLDPPTQRASPLDDEATQDDSSCGEATSPWRTIRQTIDQLTEGQPPASVSVRFDRSIEPAAADTNATDADARRVSEWLFRDPRSAPPLASGAGNRFRIVPARGGLDEWRQVAYRIKSLLLDGVRPEEIVIAARRVSGVADRARQAMAECGVPVSVDQTPTLLDAPLVRTLLSLVRLAQGDWQRDDLLSIVTTPALTWLTKPLADESPAELAAGCRRTGFADPRAATEWVLRDLLVVGGRQEWLKQLGLCRASESLNVLTPPEEGEQDAQPLHRVRRALAARVADVRLQSLAAALDACGEPFNPLAAWDQLRGLLSQLGYRAADDPLLAELDQAAINALEENFAALERLAEWRDEAAPRLSLPEVATQIAAWSRTTPLEVTRNEEGRVRLLSTENARYEQPAYLFLTGMVDGAFPTAPPASPLRLVSPSIEEHYSREMLLFFELIQAASKQVVFSYASMDDSGQPVSPSSYVAEVRRLLTPENEGATPRGDHSLRGSVMDNAAVAALSPSTWRQQAVRKLIEGDNQPLASLARRDGLRSSALLAGLEVSFDRASGDDFGEAEGMLAGKAAIGELTRRFGPKHLWSPTKLETYAQCPFKFFLSEVLRIDEPIETELKDNYRRRGAVLHDAMVRLHRRLSEKGTLLETLDSLDDEAFLAEFRVAVDEASRALPLAPKERAIADIESQQAIHWGEDYRGQLEKYVKSDQAAGGRMQPTYYEVRFGPARDPDAEVTELSRPEPFSLDLGDEKILLTGVVDRIDLGQVAGQPVFNVVDYKTSRELRPKLSDLREGRQLQLFLYTLATEHHLLADSEARPWRMGYWAIRDRGFSPPQERKKPLIATDLQEDQLCPTDLWNEYSETVRARLRQIVQGVRHGEFPMFNTDDKCGDRCEFRTTCRVNQTRSLGKIPSTRAAEASESPESS